MRRALPDDEEEVTALLKANGLEPAFELEELTVVEVEDEVVGCVGLKELPGAWVLCSLAVKKEFQGYGVGSRLVEECSKRATAPVYCLTFAPEYFMRFGFELIDKKDLPEELSGKAGFCEDSGKEWAAMRKPGR